MKKQRRENGKRKYNAQRMLIEVVTAAALLILFFTTVIGLSRVDGDSMYPTLKNNKMVAFLRIGDDYEVGDIVTIRMPSGDRYVKRIVATEGDVVSLKDGKVYVNGKEFKEDYAIGETRPQDDWVDYPYTVSENAAFVLGDNREVSIDSRTFGEIAIRSIKGKIIGKNK